MIKNTEGVLTHASLFSGIGGFDLAAQWSGFENIFQVEIDDFCQKVLTKNFPNTHKFLDIKTFDGSKYENKIDVLTGGFPCQPFSIAGKRKGSNDDRNLWSEMFRAIREIKPTWIVAENVRGILTTEGGLVFGQAITDLENEGYEIQPFIIPACAVNAPHKRDRIWIVAQNSLNSRWRHGRGEKRQPLGQFGEFKSRNGKRIYSEKTDTDTPCTRLQTKGSQFQPIVRGKRDSDVTNAQSMRCNCETFSKYDVEKMEQQNGCGLDNCPQNAANTDSEQRQFLRQQITQQTLATLGRIGNRGNGTIDRTKQFDQQWYEVASELCRVDDGIPSELDKLRNTDRKPRLKALGNAIVPQIAFNILRAIAYSFNNANEHN
jgi:DNA (cytosine-5)-methyltransferase 1